MENGNGELKQRTKVFALEVVRLCKKLDNSIGEKEIARQLVRSGMLVGANTRSAFRGRSKEEFEAKLEVVIEEADECGYWLELLEELELDRNGEISEYERLRLEASELVSIFVSIVRKYKVNKLE
jgi:four helix bundle protein